MENFEQLEQAIAALEAQRVLLGDDVVNTALAPLHEKLAFLQQRPLHEQRKLVTVLFADLVGFTSLAENMDPEDLRELLNAYFSRWTAIIERRGGLVEKFIGDAVMAVWGLPVAHENDTENAITTALEMRAALHQLNDELSRSTAGRIAGVRLSMRAGVTSGLAVTSTLAERKGQDFVVVGDTVNLASRLQTSAPEDGILISHDAYRQVRGAFNVQPLEPVHVKGKRDPQQTYLVLRAKPRAFRMATRGVEGVETRMIGRQAELKQLQELFREVQDTGESRVMTILGEAGLGKSRLIYEFYNWIELLPETWYYFRGRAFPEMQSSPYSLVRDVFAFRFRIQDGDDGQVVRSKLENGMAAVLGESQETIKKAHYLGRLLGYHIGDSPYLANVPEDAQDFRAQALSYLAEYFVALSSMNPVVFFLEDIHWADDSSLDLVNRIDGSLAVRPILVIGVARPALLERRPYWGEGLSYHYRLQLRPLSRRESRVLVREVLQRVEVLPESLRELVVSHADGNPFYIEELIKMLIEDEVIMKGEDHWRVVMERLPELRVPPTLAGVLQARFDGLSEAERLVLQRASVYGRVFWDRAVEYLGEQAPFDSEPKDVQVGSVLASLRAREMIFQREESSFVDTHEYLFKQSMLRDVTYESLLKRQRRLYHRYAAHWLEAFTQRSQRTSEFAAVIAEHFEQAGELQASAAWFRRAGEEAASRYANAEAIYALTRALELWPNWEDESRYALLLCREQVYDRIGERVKQTQDLVALDELAERMGEENRRAEVLLRRASLAFASSDYTNMLDIAQHAIQHAQAAGNQAAEISGRQYWGKALAWQSDHTGAIAQLEIALAASRSAQLTGLEAESLWNLGVVYNNLGEYDRAFDNLQESLLLYQQVGDWSGESAALAQSGAILFNRGDREGARRHFERALEIFRVMGHRFRESIMLSNLGILAYEQGQFSQAERLHEQGLAIAREIDDRYGIAVSLNNLGDLQRDMGDYPGALDRYHQALTQMKEIGDPMQESLILANQTLALYQMGNVRNALQLGRKALAVARESGAPIFEVFALARTAQALCAVGEYDEAGDLYAEALSLQEKLGLDHRQAETLVGLAGVAMKRGDLSRAMACVEKAYHYLEGGLVEGMDEPGRVYLTGFRVLLAAGDPRAAKILETGQKLITARAALILDEEKRSSFLEKVQPHRELLDLVAA